MPADFIMPKKARFYIGQGVFNFDAHSFKCALVDTLPADTDDILSKVNQIANGGGYAQSGYALSNVTWTEQADGSADFDCDDLDVTAVGAALDAFEWMVLYDDTPTSPVDPILGWFHYGSSLALAQDESVTLKLHVNGIITLD